MSRFYCIHSGVQHMLQTALALQENDMLEKVLSSYLIKSNYFNGLQKIRNKRFQKIISMRKAVDIPSDKIINVPIYEIVEIFARSVLGRNDFTFTRLPHWRDKKFAQAIIKYLNPESGGVYGFPNNVLEAFKYFPGNALKAIEQPIGYNKEALSIFGEEKELHPEFSDSITFNSDCVNYLERIDEELSLANKIFVPSRFVYNTFVKNKISESKLIINQYGSFLEPVKKISKIDSKSFTVLFVGQLTQRKGIKYLLEAIKYLKKNSVRIKLILVGQIIGKGKWKDLYDNYIDEYYPGVPRSELKKIFSRTDIFVLPSLFEGSALVTYESLANGVPCIVTPNTGADFISDGYNGYVIPIRNHLKIVEYLLQLNEDRDLLLNMKENALKSSHDLTWKNYRNRLAEHLRKF